MAKKPQRPSNVFTAPNLSGGAAFALDALMAQAQGLHQAGRLAEAEHLYREVLRRQPRHCRRIAFPRARRLPGGPSAGGRRPHRAGPGRAPDDADAHANFGLALHALQRFDQALASLERALVLRPEPSRH
jgi:tetratricopeptide (TPR) repeat protein